VDESKWCDSNKFFMQCHKISTGWSPRAGLIAVERSRISWLLVSYLATMIYFISKKIQFASNTFMLFILFFPLLQESE